MKRYVLGIASFLDKHLLLKSILKPLWRMWRAMSFQVWRTRIKFRSYNKNLDIAKTYRINPEKIRYQSLEAFHPYNDRGKIINGNWDACKNRFENLDVYSGLKEKFINGKDWGNTHFYKSILNRIVSGEIPWNCRSKCDWDKKLENVEKLYQSIKEKGFMTNKEIYGQLQMRDIITEDEITVNIGRNGDILFNDGRFRLTIAKLLKIPEVPVKILLRHPGWIQFRKELFALAQKQGGKLYHALTHPDLSDIPVGYGDERFKMIKENLSVRKGKMLDIGAHLVSSQVNIIG